MDFFRNLVFRASKNPTVAVPVGARSAGHYSLPLDHREKGLRKDFVQLFWGIVGRGEFLHRSNRHELGPSEVFVYLPGDEHRLKPLTEPWDYRWLTLDGPLNTAITESFGLSRRARRAGPCPEDLFMQMEGHLRDVTPAGERRASAVAFQILAAACAGPRRPTSEDRATDALIERIERDYADPELTVEALAREIGIHRSSLARLFKSRMGVSPQQYLLSTRMQKAMALLRETDLRVSEVAYATGYTDPNYFSRAMRKLVGLAPLEFRHH